MLPKSQKKNYPLVIRFAVLLKHILIFVLLWDYQPNNSNLILQEEEYFFISSSKQTILK